jgi:hypothetical protein
MAYMAASREPRPLVFLVVNSGEWSMAKTPEPRDRGQKQKQQGAAEKNPKKKPPMYVRTLFGLELA